MKIKVHWSFLVLGILMILFGKFQAFLCCLICAILHEMGHSFVGKKLGYKLNIITLMPYGAMLSGKNAPFSQDDEIKIAMAGPIVNLILIILCTVIWIIVPCLYSVINQFIQANIYTFVFNMLPVYPLDGGRILQAVLSKKFGLSKSKNITKIVGYIITCIIFLMFFVSFMFELNYMLGINALFMLIGLLDDDTDVYYQKLSSFEKFRFSSNNKIIRLGSDSTIFDAYKKIAHQNVNKVIFKRKNKNIVYTKNQITKKILEYPINTKLNQIEND